jgi:DNA-binding response OmpR family regulator
MGYSIPRSPRGIDGDRLLRVAVLATDERVREAALALPPPFEVTLHSTKLEALRSIGIHGCDIAVAELELGGFDFARDLRGHPKGEQIRVVMLCDRPHDRWVSFQGGADEVVVKPLPDTTSLLRAIESALRSERASRTGDARSEGMGNSPNIAS